MKAITIGFLLIIAFAFQPEITAQNAESGSSATFQSNRSVGIAGVGVRPAGLFSLRALSLLVPLTDNTEIHLAASYADGNIGGINGLIDVGDDLVIFPYENASVLIRAAAFYHSPEVSGFTTRLGVMGETVFVVTGSPGFGNTLSRLSVGSGIQKVGVACGFTWSFHPRVRLAAYYWPHYYRIVKSADFVNTSSLTRAYEKRSGMATTVLLELAIKPF